MPLGYFRDIPKIKQEWQRLKVQAKKNICSYKKDKLKTGGGPPPNEPTEMDWIIYDLIPYEFREDTSAYDCDQNKTEVGMVYSTYYGTTTPLTKR